MSILGKFTVRQKRRGGKVPLRSAPPRDAPEKGKSGVTVGKTVLSEKEKFDLCTGLDCKFVEAAPTSMCYEPMFTRGAQAVRLASIGHCKRWGAEKSGFDPNEEGLRIDNLPEPNKGVQTGNWKTDYHGCWWEVEREDGTKFWMIGEYPAEWYGAEASKVAQEYREGELLEDVKFAAEGMDLTIPAGTVVKVFPWEEMEDFYVIEYEGDAFSVEKSKIKIVTGPQPLEVYEASRIAQEERKGELLEDIEFTTGGKPHTLPAGTIVKILSWREREGAGFPVRDLEGNYVVEYEGDAYYVAEDKIKLITEEPVSGAEASKVAREGGTLGDPAAGKLYWVYYKRSGDTINYAQLVYANSPEEAESIVRENRPVEQITETRESILPVEAAKPAKVIEIADAIRRDNPGISDESAYRMAWTTYCTDINPGYEGCEGGYPQAPPATSEKRVGVEAKKVFAQDNVMWFPEYTQEDVAALSDEALAVLLEAAGEWMEAEWDPEEKQKLTIIFQTLLEETKKRNLSTEIGMGVKKVFSQDETPSPPEPQEGAVEVGDRFYDVEQGLYFVIAAVAGDEFSGTWLTGVYSGLIFQGKVSVLLGEVEKGNIERTARTIFAQDVGEIKVGSYVRLVEDLDISGIEDRGTMPVGIVLISKGTEVFVTEDRGDTVLVIGPFNSVFPLRKDQVSTAPFESLIKAQEELKAGDKVELLEDIFSKDQLWQKAGTELTITDEGADAALFGRPIVRAPDGEEFTVTLDQIRKVAQEERGFEVIIRARYAIPVKAMDEEDAIGKARQIWDGWSTPGADSEEIEEVTISEVYQAHRKSQTEMVRCPRCGEEAPKEDLAPHPDERVREKYDLPWNETSDVCSNCRLRPWGWMLGEGIIDLSQRRSQVPEDEIKPPIGTTDRTPGGFSKVMNWSEVQEHEHHSDLYESVEEAQNDLTRFEMAYGVSPAIVFCPDEGQYAILAG